MKKIFYLSIIAGLVSLTSCNEEKLETFPTDEVSVEQIFSSADAAQYIPLLRVIPLKVLLQLLSTLKLNEC